MIDKEMINGILNENENALEELKNNYGRLIYGVINKILNNSMEVSEIDECFNDGFYASGTILIVMMKLKGNFVIF